jgi:hypothetical protein
MTVLVHCSDVQRWRLFAATSSRVCLCSGSPNLLRVSLCQSGSPIELAECFSPTITPVDTQCCDTIAEQPSVRVGAGTEPCVWMDTFAGGRGERTVRATAPQGCREGRTTHVRPTGSDKSLSHFNFRLTLMTALSPSHQQAHTPCPRSHFQSVGVRWYLHIGHTSVSRAAHTGACVRVGKRAETRECGLSFLLLRSKEKEVRAYVRTLQGREGATEATRCRR